jgi:hypothetical protein
MIRRLFAAAFSLTVLAALTLVGVRIARAGGLVRTFYTDRFVLPVGLRSPPSEVVAGAHLEWGVRNVRLRPTGQHGPLPRMRDGDQVGRRTRRSRSGGNARLATKRHKRHKKKSPPSFFFAPFAPFRGHALLPVIRNGRGLGPSGWPSSDVIVGCYRIAIDLRVFQADTGGGGFSRRRDGEHARRLHAGDLTKDVGAIGAVEGSKIVSICASGPLPRIARSGTFFVSVCEEMGYDNVAPGAQSGGEFGRKIPSIREIRPLQAWRY